MTLAVTALASSGVNAQSTANARPGEFVVKISSGKSVSEVRQLADQANCELVRAVPHCPGYYLFRQKGIASAAPGVGEPVSAASLETLNRVKQLNGVLAADPNYMVSLAFRGRPQEAKVSQAPPAPGKTRATQPPSSVTLTPNDPLYSRMWGLRAIRMPEAWAIQFGRRPVVVGVADSGIDVGHPDFNATDGSGTRIVGGQNFFPDDGTNVVPGAIQDINGHGTHVAGSVAATTNNSVGVASVAGWGRAGVDVRIRVARVFGAPLTAPVDVIYAGVGYLVDQDVDVINLSLGGSVNTQIGSDTVARAIAAGIVVVAAAGNANSTGPAFPADLPGVIKVSAIGPDFTRASYSNYSGPVAIAAPGGDGAEGSDDAIWSTWPRAGGSLGPGQGGYFAINGTSMACPHVAGACALLIANGGPDTPVEVKRIIQENAIRLDEPPNFDGGNQYGAGLLDVYSMILPYADPPFSVGVVGPVDLGSTFIRTLPRILLQFVGVTKAPSPASITVEIQSATIPTSVFRTLVGGVDFQVPTTVPEGAPIATPVTVQVPAPDRDPIVLPPGRFKIVVKNSGTVVGTQFIEVVSYTIPLGRSLFSTPFQVRQIEPFAPETRVLGAQTTFTLARYQPFRLPSDFDYALFQSSATGRRDSAASFSALAPDGSPVVYQLSTPGVSIAPVGLGYWLNLDRGVEVNTDGPVATEPVAIRLFAANGGWNMIGAPFPSATGWGTATVRVGADSFTLEEAIARGTISPALIGYANGDYVYYLYPEGRLEPFQGYWVRVLEDCTLIIAPSSGNARSRSRSAATITTANGSGWQARIGAVVAGDRDSQNYFGQKAGAEDGMDRYDIPKPPSGSGHAYVRFLTGPEGRAQAQAFDLRAPGSRANEWTAAVSTDRTNADVVLTWDGLGNAPRRMDLILTDVATGKTVDMRGRSSYTFRSGEAGSTRLFKITLNPAQSGGPLAIRNVSVVGGRSQSQPGMAVRFSTSRDAEVKGVIKALNGKVVGDLTGTSRSAANGITTLRWNGRSRAGNPVAPGPYLIEITAQAGDGSKATYAQTVQNIQ